VGGGGNVYCLFNIYSLNICVNTDIQISVTEVTCSLSLSFGKQFFCNVGTVDRIDLICS